MLVQGPYLVRGATLSHDRQTLLATGDVANSTTIEAFAPNCVKTLSWNGKSIRTTRTSYGSLVGKLAAPDSSKIVLPALTSWISHDSLPERLPTYDDSGEAWVGMLAGLV